MLGTRHEEYGNLVNGLPFVLHINLQRNAFYCSKENNWHDEPELQFCVEGSGTVLLDGVAYPFRKNDLVAVDSNVLHYTGTKTELTYSCLIFSSEFCRLIGVNLEKLHFSPLIRSDVLTQLFMELIRIYCDETDLFRIAKLNRTVLSILIELAEHHCIVIPPTAGSSKKYDTVKMAISYIREHYRRKITLDEIAASVLSDKYVLCREFKKLTGQTIVEHLNRYRCIKAIDCLNDGKTVAEAAFSCGFENNSFFTKIFKRYTGHLPSDYKA